MQTIQESIEQLRSALRDYIEATYHVGAKPLITQRRRLLGQDGVIHQKAYLESTPRYPTGTQFSNMLSLPEATLEVFIALSKPKDDLPQLIHDPPYQHQSKSINESLIQHRNLIVMTGTGSGKTECFLLPILGKLAREAKDNPDSFRDCLAMRALILYPMNALVNDQLGRLRALFGDPRLVELFKRWAGRPPRFARYTSRTPYPGVRTPEKDSVKFKSFNEFYANIESQARNPNAEGHAEAKHLLQTLKDHGKWPAKPNLTTWLGEKGSRWKDKNTEDFIRAVTLPDDSELLTRHEVQNAPPDILVTNYSMLEYMLMRPIERPIFDATRKLFEKNPDEKFLVVLDEAHLYRGAAGAEVGLLLRRLRDRLNILTDQFQVICATASFNDHAYAPSFGAQLSGLPADSFVPISGTLDLKPNDDTGTDQDANLLAGIDFQKFYEATTDAERIAVIKPLLEYRNVVDVDSPEAALYHALVKFAPMCRLINNTMKQAIPVADLGTQLFPSTPSDKANSAVTVLIALGSIARRAPNTPGLLPCRIHNFFRGLPGLWICMDPSCSEINKAEKNGICGKMYSQPHNTCKCGARVLELYTCRNCGTAYARAYTDNIDDPTTLWPEPGQSTRVADGQTDPLLPLDLLLETPTSGDIAEPADYDLETGRLNPASLGSRTRRVYIRSERSHDQIEEDEEHSARLEMCGQFIPCAVCNKSAPFGNSYVQDHQTKGDQPFQVLVTRQLQIQPPGPAQSTPFAPLRGRKVLTFSDSRQVAARLAPNLQMYSVRDSLRSLIMWGYRQLQKQSLSNLNLEDIYLAVLLASKELNVRLRPEMKSGESFNAEQIVENALQKNSIGSVDGLSELRMEIRSEPPPEALLDNIISAIQDRFLGFEALALGSIAERSKHTSELEKLPAIPTVAETPETKIALVRTWLRCWKNYGFWLSAMPTTWWRGNSSEGTTVRGHKTGKFKAMDQVLADRSNQKLFRQWLPTLLDLFTEDMNGNTKRLRGAELTLMLEGSWNHCVTCKSIHRPISSIKHCIDCGSANIRIIDPNEDPVFLARKGFYRKSVMQALEDPPLEPLVLVAAEHTAQLNAPQNEDIFSKAEENELFFQDIEFSVQDQRSTAIDVLSSTTTMEVGIDIGALSGVALRNMPPSRANYQQRSGRAGRRGNAIATVIAFGSVDSHDEHYFRNPDDMIRGNVIDPKLALDNLDIIRRHVRAFLLQNYHQERLPQINLKQGHDLFSVLGTVSDFCDSKSILNRENFADWLSKNKKQLRSRISSWIPKELHRSDQILLLDTMIDDCLKAVDEAIHFTSSKLDLNKDRDEDGDETMNENTPEEGEERPLKASNLNKLLDRLLYYGMLPRYAFPTDVATFYVFDRERSSRFRPIMRFSPQQALSVALTQYAPGKQVWISGKCYTSEAIYSSIPGARWAAWKDKRIYLECSECGFAKTCDTNEATKNDKRECEACGSDQTLGPGRYWLRPPGFAHPVDVDEVTSPDDVPETSYATRAKLSMDTPGNKAGWITVNKHVRVLGLRQLLLVSNTGPRKEGYTYCTKCGRIEASTNPLPKLVGSHPKPFPSDSNNQDCNGSNPARHVVLGTDFITDIALFSLRVKQPISLKPGYTSTNIVLRTVSEALASAACQLLEIEPGEIMAEFRPALTPNGKTGLEAEIFLYDTLPGGAGFSSQLADRGLELLELALELMQACPENCDASCYRCLRSFKNKFEHALLDRYIGAELLNHLLNKGKEFDYDRLRSSSKVLFLDLQRQISSDLKISMNTSISVDGEDIIAPILIENEHGQKFLITLSAPLAPDHPSDPKLASLFDLDNTISIIVENEILVRRNLPEATQNVLSKIKKER